MFGQHCFRMVGITTVLILAIFSMETLASPLNLEVSIRGVKNGNSTEQSEPCIGFWKRCPLPPAPNQCCKGLVCSSWYELCGHP